MLGLFGHELRVTLGELTGLQRYEIEQIIEGLPIRIETAPAGNAVLIISKKKQQVLKGV